MMRDQDFGMIRVRAFGIFAYRVKDPVIFLKDIFGTQSSYKSSQISGQLKAKIVSMLSDILAESQIPALDFSVHYNELSLEGLRKLKDAFYSLGFELNNFVIENISLPEEVEAAMDKRTSMGVLGNLNQYAQYQAAEAMRDAANNPGNSTASTGVGLGAGVAMGQMFTKSFQQDNGNQGNSGQSDHKILCPHCQKPIEKDSKFCPGCGKSVQADKIPCSKCGKLNHSDNKFCSDCGNPMVLKCKACGKDLKSDAKFCPECGESVQ
jgi:membrane protease subunit (stomatin/prohibitin family)